MKRWWERRTLRFRLALWYALGGSALLAAFSATLYSYVARRMAQPLDYELRRDLREIHRSLELRPDGALRWRGVEIPEHADWPAQNPWFELWDENGKLVRRLWPFAESHVNRLPAAPASGRETLSVFDVADDLRLRVLSVPYALPEGRAGWMIRVIRIHEPAGDALGALRWIIFIALPIVITLLVLVGYWFIRRWLFPLDQMVAEANRITADDLGRRLSVANPHDELGRLATVFNVTLDRLEASFVALDRFVADASHELRTPLTTLRSVGEVGLRRSRTVEEYREIIGSMLEESQRLHALIQKLLELASAEAGGAVLHRSEVKLDECVAACVNEIAILAESKGQRLMLGTQPFLVVTDPVIFRQALQNLVENAIKYCPVGATIRVDVRDAGERLHVVVTDDGPGIGLEAHEHLMERFFRPDRARGRSSGGFGLGLAITKAYARALGGALEYESVEPHGSSFRLVLPRT